jgi:hypothetical protein
MSPIRDDILLVVLPPTQNKCHYGKRADQILLSLTRFIENVTNICISK